MVQSKMRRNEQSPEIGKFQLRRAENRRPPEDSEVHVFGQGNVCATDTKGHETPGGRSRFEIRLDATEGYIPLWARGVTLRWRFQEQSFEPFEDPEGVKAEVRKTVGRSCYGLG